MLFFFIEPKYCGYIFEHNGGDKWKGGWATLFDGAKLGYTTSLNLYPSYVGNDRLSTLMAEGG